MALMGRRPRVLRVGADTQGVFSDVLDFEARGVAPDVRVSVFPQDDLIAGRDSALERALDALAGDRKQN
jgi:C-terminal processing protease CtpA/Prc